VRPPPDGPRATWLGHSTVLLEAGGVRLLTDPVLRRRVAHLRRHGDEPAAPPSVDAVLLSHLHRDHADAPSLRRVAGDGDVPVLVPRGAGRIVQRLGAREVQEVAPGDAVRVGDATVRAVPAVHDGRRTPWSRARPDALGFVVDAGPRVYFAGDTALYDDMADHTGPVDLALLPIWGWGPTLGAGHMDPRDAARAAALLRPGLALPIHWATFLPLHVRDPARLLAAPGRAFALHAADLAPGVPVAVVAPGTAVALPSAGGQPAGGAPAGA
jgi:L-ascorbate metabolism protein UlaG (beta-lactamase superfamily)